MQTSSFSPDTHADPFRIHCLSCTDLIRDTEKAYCGGVSGRQRTCRASVPAQTATRKHTDNRTRLSKVRDKVGRPFVHKKEMWMSDGNISLIAAICRRTLRARSRGLDQVALIRDG